MWDHVVCSRLGVSVNGLHSVTRSEDGDFPQRFFIPEFKNVSGCLKLIASHDSIGFKIVKN